MPDTSLVVLLADAMLLKAFFVGRMQWQFWILTTLSWAAAAINFGDDVTAVAIIPDTPWSNPPPYWRKGGGGDARKTAWPSVELALPSQWRSGRVARTQQWLYEMAIHAQSLLPVGWQTENVARARWRDNCVATLTTALHSPQGLAHVLPPLCDSVITLSSSITSFASAATPVSRDLTKGLLEITAHAVKEWYKMDQPIQLMIVTWIDMGPPWLRKIARYMMDRTGELAIDNVRDWVKAKFWS
ncbi:hypothetical protein B0T17DRAFT_597759 [Bombardia bombarda]|uniref:Uncharacterized protein n=1 Tax=Bombardia bombarda TaxID=252184 RepID=A0AA39X923_9PEZI|nr:hypothetical protein B0T17DRAFT_597759 [Bombardia bombarda]